MASITIRNLDDAIKRNLRLRAAQHGWSMEQEVREILQRSLMPEAAAPGFAQRLHQRFADLELNLELDTLPLPARRIARTPPTPES